MLIAVTWSLSQVFLKVNTWSFHCSSGTKDCKCSISFSSSNEFRCSVRLASIATAPWQGMGFGIGAPLIFSIFSQLTFGIIGSAYLSAPLGLHLGFVPSCLFPVAEADGLDQNSCGIKIQFCLNFGHGGTESMLLKGAGNGKIISQIELPHEQSWNNAKCCQSYIPLAETQVIISQVTVCPAAGWRQPGLCHGLTASSWVTSLSRLDWSVKTWSDPFWEKELQSDMCCSI